MDWKKSLLLKCLYYQSHLQIQYDRYQNINDIFYKTRKTILTFIWNHEKQNKTKNKQSIHEQK
jgi:hypothetical protein